MPVLKAKVNGVWAEVGVAPESEVEVSDTEPTTEWDIWVDTSAVQPPPGVVGLAIDDLTDVDTTTEAPADSDGLVWSSAASNWTPQPVWKAWSGTQAEYDAIPTKSDDTLYAIV